MSAEANVDTHVISLIRDIWENPLFVDQHEAGLFVWMVSTAAASPVVVRTPWGPVSLKTGELITSERDLSTRFTMHRNKVRKVIARMVEAGMISESQGACNHNAGTIWAVNPLVMQTKGAQS
jgi:hypothetical protein